MRTKRTTKRRVQEPCGIESAMMPMPVANVVVAAAVEMMMMMTTMKEITVLPVAAD